MLFRTKQWTYLGFVTILVLLFIAGCSSPTPTPISPTVTISISPTASPPVLPTAIDSEIIERGVETGVDELDRVIQIIQDGDVNALRSLVRYTRSECTFEDGLGGPPSCKEGEAEGKMVEVLPFLGPEGHFIRKEDIDSWIGIDASDLYAVYSVSDLAFPDPIYPGGEYAIAFINEARFLITTLHIVEGYIVRVDSDLGNPPGIQTDDVDTYLIPPMELDQ